MSTSASKSTTASKSKTNLADEDFDSYSDEFDSEDNEEETNTTPPPQKKRKAPEKTKTPSKSPINSPDSGPGKPSHTECKQLAADIIQGGGLANFSLTKCIAEYKKLKENPYHLATPNSAKLKSLQNKITYWKGRGRDNFNNYALSQAATRVPASNSLPSESSRAATLTDPVESPQLAKYVPPPAKYIRPFQPDAPSVIMDDTIRSNSAKAEVINVNLVHPEKNGPVMIYKITNVEVDKVLYDGFILELQDIDNRFITDVKEEAVQMHAVSPNELLLKAPSTCFPYLHSPKDEEIGRKKAGLDGSVYKNATETTRTAIIGNSGRQFSYFKFIFPKALDNDVFTKDAEHGKIEPKLVPLSQEIAIPVYLASGAKVEDAETGEYMTVFHKVCLRSNICFVIAEAEGTKRRLQSTKKKNMLTDQLTSMFDDMEV